MAYLALFCQYIPLVITLKSFILTYTPLTLSCQGHAIVSDGLFLKTSAFYVMPDVDLEPLEEIFRAKVFTIFFVFAILDASWEKAISYHLNMKGYPKKLLIFPAAIMFSVIVSSFLEIAA